MECQIPLSDNDTYIAASHESLGVSPAIMNYGRQPLLPGFLRRVEDYALFEYLNQRLGKQSVNRIGRKIRESW